MVGRFDDIIEITIAIKENTEEDKVVSLKEAIKRNVKPGAKINIGTTHCCPSAAILEIARQFHGKNPEFTLIMREIRDTVIIWFHMGLIKKVITSFSGNVYPWYSPNPVIQKAYVNKEVELEDWSILIFPFMLMAGALGVGFMPTKLIVCTTMAKDNQDSYRRSR